MYNYNGELVNEDLRHIDPYSPNITDKEKEMVLLECKLNYKYLINSIIKKNHQDSLLNKIYKEVVEGDEKFDNTEQKNS